jgi:hypothetical protein
MEDFIFRFLSIKAAISCLESPFKKDSHVEMMGMNKVFDQARNFNLQVEAQKIQPRL